MDFDYYADMKDSTLSELLKQAIINTENQFMAFSDSICQYCPDKYWSTGAYMIFYQSGPIDHDTHFPLPVDQSNAENEYNIAYTTGTALENFRMLKNELLNNI